MRNEGFISRNISGFTNSLELAMVTENLSKSQGLLQVLDPRIKLVTLLLFIIIVGLAQNIWILVYFLALAMALCLLVQNSTSYFPEASFFVHPRFHAYHCHTGLVYYSRKPIMAGWRQNYYYGRKEPAPPDCFFSG